MKSIAILLIFSVLLLVGCKEDYPVYSSFCEQDKKDFPKCLRYAVLNAEDKRVIENAFGMKEDVSCPYRVELTRYHTGLCDNPATKISRKDFNGYVRIEVKKSFKCYYKVQSDFKNDENAALERVLQKVKDERKNKNKSN